MKKWLQNILTVGAFVLCFPLISFAITVGVVNKTGVAKKQPRVQQQSTVNLKEKTIRLLSWKGDYLRTTAGTIYTKGIDVVNVSGMDLNKIARSNKHPVVEFVLQENRVKKIYIYPASGQ